jgi:hypothetical protein
MKLHDVLLLLLLLAPGMLPPGLGVSGLPLASAPGPAAQVNTQLVAVVQCIPAA